jgi:ArsR family transcriptional regulator, cadmium/lead-responsive transcriptional repressor
VTTSQGSADPRPGALPASDADEQLWEAIAEPSRRRVLDLIVARGEATATMLAAELPFTRQAVAKHLAVLTRAGLVEGRKQGREVRYSVVADRLDAASQAMAHVAARWDVRLRAIKRIAETQAAAARSQSDSIADVPHR